MDVPYANSQPTRTRGAEWTPRCSTRREGVWMQRRARKVLRAATGAEARTHGCTRHEEGVLLRYIRRPAVPATGLRGEEAVHAVSAIAYELERE